MQFAQQGETAVADNVIEFEEAKKRKGKRPFDGDGKSFRYLVLEDFWRAGALVSGAKLEKLRDALDEALVFGGDNDPMLAEVHERLGDFNPKEDARTIKQICNMAKKMVSHHLKMVRSQTRPA